MVMNMNNLTGNLGHLLATTGAAIPANRILGRSAYQQGESRKIVGFLSQAVDYLYLWHARRTQRQALMQMGDHQLKDIGISRSDAVHEWQKPFWRV
jgi:uncharacterized protein YjiS (DUF1127 family)